MLNMGIPETGANSIFCLLVVKEVNELFTDLFLSKCDFAFFFFFLILAKYSTRSSLEVLLTLVNGN